VSGGSYKDLVYFKKPSEFMPIRETRPKRKNPEEVTQRLNDYQMKALKVRGQHSKSTKS
jgi:hypothetical protein